MNKKIIGSSVGFIIGLVLGFLSYISMVAGSPERSISGIVLWLVIVLSCTIWGWKEGKKFTK